MIDNEKMQIALKSYKEADQGTYRPEHKGKCKTCGCHP